MDSSVQRCKHQLDMLILKLSQSQHHSTPEQTGVDVFTKSETKLNAVHAGLSVLLKLSQTDSALLQVEPKILCFPQKTWLNATTQTWVAKEDG